MSQNELAFLHPRIQHGAHFGKFLVLLVKCNFLNVKTWTLCTGAMYLCHFLDLYNFIWPVAESLSFQVMTMLMLFIAPRLHQALSYLVYDRSIFVSIPLSFLSYQSLYHFHTATFKLESTYHVLYFHTQPCVQSQVPRCKNINIQALLYFFFFLSHWSYIARALELIFPAFLSMPATVRITRIRDGLELCWKGS